MLKSALPFVSLLVGCSCTSIPAIDPQNAVSANDLTALLSGCGQQQVGVGYIVCRMTDGQPTSSEKLYIHAPPQVECDREACVYFKIYFPDGRPTYSGVVKKGESSAAVSFANLVDKEVFEVPNRGFYAVSVTIHYKDKSGIEKQTYADGYIFLHVVRKNYISLLENREDENFRWTWKTDTNQTVKVTSGFRVFLSSFDQASPNTPELLK